MMAAAFYAGGYRSAAQYFARAKQERLFKHSRTAEDLETVSVQAVSSRYRIQDAPVKTRLTRG